MNIAITLMGKFSEKELTILIADRNRNVREILRRKMKVIKGEYFIS